MENDQKLQAAIAGVMYYMATEEDGQQAAAATAVPAASPWALNSRQTIMQWRTLVQRRAVRR